MKNIALPISASIYLFFASCSDNPPKDSGQEQVPAPVMNSGPETEAARATTAIKDSTKAGGGADTVPTTDPHNH